VCQTEACVIACERQTNRNLRGRLDVVVEIMSLAEPRWCYYPHGQKPGDQLQVFVTITHSGPPPRERNRAVRSQRTGRPPAWGVRHAGHAGKGAERRGCLSRASQLKGEGPKRREGEPRQTKPQDQVTRQYP
jgi:hypothetical protein